MHPLAKRLYIALTLAVAGFASGVGHWGVNVLFQNPALNHFAFVILVLSIPVLLMALAWVTINNWGKAALIIMGVISLFPSIPIGALAAFQGLQIFELGKDSSFEKVAELPHGSKALRLYVSNCGAICDFGLVLREEFDMPLGLKVTRTIWSANDTSDMATMRRLDDTKVQVIQRDGAIDDVSL